MMSRYTIEAHDEDHEIVIGWDAPLANFFLQVKNRWNDEAQPFVWLGAEGYGTQTDVDLILAEAAKWGPVRPDLRADLLSDQQTQGTQPKNPLLSALLEREPMVYPQPPELAEVQRQGMHRRSAN
jgi:hypothetical protein